MENKKKFVNENTFQKSDVKQGYCRIYLRISTYPVFSADSSNS